jgi:type IV secretion system protein VirB4
MGGVYSKLVPGRPTGWNPFQLPETEINKHFLRDFLKVLSTCDTEALTAQDINQITEVVERNYTLPHNIRNLSTISHFFTSDFKGLSALSRYLRLPDKTGRVGDRAYLFDNDTDVLSFDTRTMGFDMTYLLNDTGERVEELLPVSMYLFHRLEAELNANHLTGLYLDEGWQFLNNPYWIGKIGESLVTWRKRNAYVVFATQLPDKIAQSPLASSLIQGSATNIFLANSKAQEKDYIDGFKLTHRELEIIKNTQLQSRYFLYKQNNEAAIVRINLSGVEKYISILSSTSQSVSLCDDIRAEVGDESAKWLSIFYDKQKEGNRA